jgi:hypothetical protein
MVGTRECESWIASSLSLPCANASRLSQAMTANRDKHPPSRGAIRPSCARTSSLENRGRRECRAPDAPAASCAKVESTRVRNHRLTGNTRHSLRNGFNGLLRALPGDEFLLSPSSTDKGFVQARSGRRNLRGLNISNGCQDHTTSPSAKALFVRALGDRSQVLSTHPAIPVARPTLPRPPHPVPYVRDDRDTPLVSAKSARMCERAVLQNRPSLELSPLRPKGGRAW